ncbi:MAG TPA: hypothetical protein VJM11_12760 [Nevskiaceae bacterium]|nr:hypothetical protein [Nevskiaceae bacterium]
MRITFPFLGQAHQVFHALPIAASIAQRHPDVEVHVAAFEPARMAFVRALLARHAPDARIAFDPLPIGFGDAWRLRRGTGRTFLKSYALARNARYFRGFDAIVTPERTSLVLRRLGVRTPLVWTRHGAGDREIGFAADVKHFDFVLLAGRKIEQRLLKADLIRPGRYAGGVYAKFDWARGAPDDPLFANARRTVLYNPHFRTALSSWPKLGHAVLEALSRSGRYNVVFAPHVRLFEAAEPAQRAAFDRYAAMDHVRVDLGSERSIDMSYTQAADLYLGDVSSQVAEFVCRPRPCLFLDAHATAWRGDPNYASWRLGEVCGSAQDLEARLDAAFERHREFESVQRAYIDETFGLPPGPSAPRGADAIVAFARGRMRRSAPRAGGHHATRDAVRSA